MVSIPLENVEEDTVAIDHLLATRKDESDIPRMGKKP
jgi:hypothetical protein